MKCNLELWCKYLVSADLKLFLTNFSFVFTFMDISISHCDYILYVIIYSFIWNSICSIMKSVHFVVWKIA
jgi:hypothetical protein